ncbi:MAG: hypothetical protein M1817_000900 [Caeruleum heppii]|nr:MAG: hypothetical protein M1817_000900 [Caeruleum heppii]
MLPTPAPVPSKGVLRLLRQLAYASSFTGALLVEDQRRRVGVAREIHDNARELKKLRRYHSVGAAVSVTRLDEASLSEHGGKILGSRWSAKSPLEDRAPEIARTAAVEPSPHNDLTTSGNDAHGRFKRFVPESSRSGTRAASIAGRSDRMHRARENSSHTRLDVTRPRMEELPAQRSRRQSPALFKPGSSVEARPKRTASITGASLGIRSQAPGIDPERCINPPLDSHISLTHAHRPIAKATSHVAGNNPSGDATSQIFDPLRPRRTGVEDTGPRLPPRTSRPTSLDLPAKRIDDLIETGYVEEAINLFISAIPVDAKPRNARGIRELAERLCTEGLDAGLTTPVTAIFSSLAQIDILSVDCWDKALRALDDRRDHAAVLALFTAYANELSPLVDTYHIIIKAYVHEMRLEEAEELLARAFERSNGPLFTKKAILNLLGETWRTSKDLKLTRDLFTRLEARYGDRIAYVQVFNTMIGACVEAGRDDEAQKYLFHMADKYRLNPGPKTSSHLLLSLAKRREWDAVHAGLKALGDPRRGSSTRHDRASIFIPILIEHLNSNSILESMRFVRTAITEYHVVPNRYLSNLIVSQLSKTDEWDAMAEWLQAVNGHDIMFNADTLSRILKRSLQRFRPDVADLRRFRQQVRELDSTLMNSTNEEMIENIISSRPKGHRWQFSRGRPVDTEVFSPGKHPRPTQDVRHQDVIEDDEHDEKAKAQVYNYQPFWAEGIEPVAKKPSTSEPSAQLATEMMSFLHARKPDEALASFERSIATSNTAYRSQLALRCAVEASLRVHQGHPEHAKSLLTNAAKFGVNTAQAIIPLLVSRMNRLERIEQENVLEATDWYYDFQRKEHGRNAIDRDESRRDDGDANGSGGTKHVLSSKQAEEVQESTDLNEDGVRTGVTERKIHDDQTARLDTERKESPRQASTSRNPDHEKKQQSETSAVYRHNVTIQAAFVLTNKGDPSKAIRLLTSLEDDSALTSGSPSTSPLNSIVAMTVLLRAYTFLNSLQGVHWTITAILTRNILIDEKLLRELSRTKHHFHHGMLGDTPPQLLRKKQILHQINALGRKLVARQRVQRDVSRRWLRDLLRFIWRVKRNETDGGLRGWSLGRGLEWAPKAGRTEGRYGVWTRSSQGNTKRIKPSSPEDVAEWESAREWIAEMNDDTSPTASHLDSSLPEGNENSDPETDLELSAPPLPPPPPPPPPRVEDLSFPEGDASEEEVTRLMEGDEDFAARELRVGAVRSGV